MSNETLPAPAPATDAGELTGVDQWWLAKYDGALNERDAQRCRAEAAEAERDRLAEQNAALLREAQVWAGEARAQRATVHESYQAATGATGEPGDWNGAEPVRALVAERDRLALEVAALRGAMPDAGLILRAQHIAYDAGDADLCDKLIAAHARIRALATATPTPPAAVPRPDLERARILADDHDSANVDPESDGSDYTAATIRALCDYIDAIQPTPPAAEAVTVWTREAPTEAGWRWVMIYGHDRPDVAYVRYFCGDWCAKIGDTEYGPVVIQLYGPPVVVPPGWVAALDQPQEADHATA